MVGPADLLRRAAQLHGSRVAVRCDGEAQDYATLWRRSCRLANALTGLGVEQGDRVALLSDNSLIVPEQMAAVAAGNFVRAALYSHVHTSANLDALNLVGARALIVQADLYGTIAHRLDEAEALEHVVVYDGDAPDGTLAYEALLDAASPADPGIVPAPGDAHAIRFSAGTTGKPKGILHTVERAMAHGNEVVFALPRLTEDDVYLAAGPLPHASGVLLWPLTAVGAEIVVMPAFSPERVLGLIEERRVTLSFVVATMVRMIVTHPDAKRHDLSSLRALVYGGSPIAERTLVEAIGTWGNIMYQMYGQSEGGPIGVLEPRHHRPDGTDRERRWLRSAGRPATTAKLRIVDEDGCDVPPGEFGEIAFDCGARMERLWGDPAGTAERMLPDGCLRTSDMGSMDEDGFIYLADRKEDMIVSGGFNIWPGELENVLGEHPDVLEACVVGVPDEKWGETPKGVVVLADDASATAGELVEWTREQLGSTKKVTSIDFVDELPKSAIGKVLRRSVRERYWTGDESRVAGA